jgi:hypothetical protein
MILLFPALMYRRRKSSAFSFCIRRNKRKGIQFLYKFLDGVKAYSIKIGQRNSFFGIEREKWLQRDYDKNSFLIGFKTLTFLNIAELILVS